MACGIYTKMVDIGWEAARLRNRGEDTRAARYAAAGRRLAAYHIHVHGSGCPG